jgi:hypothetical protein
VFKNLKGSEGLNEDSLSTYLLNKERERFFGL